MKTWQQELAEGYSNIQDLCNYLQIQIDPKIIDISTPHFPMRVPREFVARMEKGNLNDPLLKQILPLIDENTDSPGFSKDPVGDINAVSEVGVIHKYESRALFITHGSCAINCRYCFRRNFPYSDFQLSTQKLAKAIAYIANHPDITEVILSGGDSLLLSDEKIFTLLHQLDQIKHLKRIRVHSRIPIVLPTRITTEFCNILKSFNKMSVLVVHSNHTNELNFPVKQACKKLKQAGITLFNQSVLLKGINDNEQQLCALNEKLFSFGIIPYYLHMLDKATGTAHFEVDQNTAIVLMNQIKMQLSGYLVPKLVREQTGAKNKIVLA